MAPVAAWVPRAVAAEEEQGDQHQLDRLPGVMVRRPKSSGIVLFHSTRSTTPAGRGWRSRIEMASRTYPTFARGALLGACLSSVVTSRQEPELEPAQALRVRDQLDLHDPSPHDRDAEDHARLTARRPHQSHRSVHQCRPRHPRGPRTSPPRPRRRGPPPARPPGPPPRRPAARRPGRAARAAPGSHRRARRRGTRPPRPAGGYVGLACGARTPRRALHPPARAARELPRRGGRAAHDGCDLVERQVEHVVQHERHPLGGRQRLEHHQQREPDRVGQQRLVLGVA